MTEHQASRAKHQGDAPCVCTEGWVCEAHPESGFPHGDCPAGKQCTCAQGSRALLRDVIACPPDQQALGLVEAILAQAAYSLFDKREQLAVRLGVIHDNACRLAVLLDERDAEREGLATALDALLAVIDESEGIEGWHMNGAIAPWSEFEFIEQLRAALAHVKGGS